MQPEMLRLFNISMVKGHLASFRRCLSLHLQEKQLC